MIRDKDSYVALKFMENNRRVRETVYGREYTISAELTQPNGTYGIKVKNCIAFNKKNVSYPLINEKGYEENYTKWKSNSEEFFFDLDAPSIRML